MLIGAAFATGESSVETKTETSKQNQTFPLITSGLDNKVAVLRAAGATKIKEAHFSPLILTDLTGHSQPVLLSRGAMEKSLSRQAIELCDGAAMTNERLRQLTSKAGNALSYYELEIAEKHLTNAAGALVCLQEPLDQGVAQRLYYLQGMLAHYREDNSTAEEAFTLAIRFQPDLQWDDNFGEKGIDLFESARRAFSRTIEVPLKVVPRSATQHIRINGVPLYPGDEQKLFAGRSVVQVMGLTVQTTEMTIDPRTAELTLIVPSTVPPEASSWVAEEAGRSELSFLFSNSLENKQHVYIHDRGRIWHTEVGTETWQELNVPGFVEARANAKALFGKSLFWTGAVVLGSGLAYSGYQYVTGYSTSGAADRSDSWSDFSALQNTHESASAQYRVGWIGTAVGCGMMAAGYSLQF